MSTQIQDLQIDSIIKPMELDYDDLQSIVMTLSNTTEDRLKAMRDCYNQDDHRAIECLSTLVSQYQMSGIKNIETFLHGMCEIKELPSFFRLEAAKALIEYEEIEDSDDEDEETDDIRRRNKIRQDIGAHGLEAICLTMGEIPTPCRVKAVCLLMRYDAHSATADKCFKLLINDSDLECDFRYKCILDLEHRGSDDMKEKLSKEFEDKEFVKYVYEENKSLISREFPKFKPGTGSLPFFKLILDHISYSQLLNTFRGRFIDDSHSYEPFIHSAQMSFLTTKSNYTSYRILACQYILQKFTDCKDEVYSVLLSFAQDTQLDYNIRADATDVLMQLGNNKMKELGREIIIELGECNGRVDTLFDNAQNVHAEEVEESVSEVLEFFATLPTMKVGKSPIEFDYVKKHVLNMLDKLKRDKSIERKDEIQCKFCNNDVTEEFCSEECSNLIRKTELINLSLNRIEMDRALYSKFNSTLVNILIKVWTYITGHEHEIEMRKRLLQELEEMSGTCSSGYASRLINVVSGFGEFNIRISWEDQIKANFSGRLNASARKITTPESIFRKEPYLTDLIMLCLNEDEIANGDVSSKSVILKKYKNKHPELIMTQKELVKEYLGQPRNEDIVEYCVEQLSESVLSEIMLPSSLSAQRQYFSLFFRVNASFIREEMYIEFKDYMDDATFDLYMRKGLMNYEGIR